MVSTPGDWRLPASPASAGAQIEASFALWLRGARAALPFALLYTLAGLLPMLSFGDLGARLARLAARVLWFAFDPRQPDPTGELMPLLRALQAWAVAPATLLLAALALALALYAVNGVLLRLHAIARGTPRAPVAMLALRRWPRAFAAWAVYSLVLLACAALVAGFVVAMFVLALGLTDLGLLALLLVVMLAGSLLLSAPLAWASVAFGYAPLLATLDGAGPFAAHRDSARRVRGHWVRAATVVTVPLLVYLGVGSALSSLAYTAIGAGVYVAGGLPALLEGRWLAWVPWACALPMALALPLAFAGMIASLHDLRQRAQATR